MSGLPSITLIQGKGNTGGQLIGKEHICGLFSTLATLPSGFTLTDNVKEVFGIAQAEALGFAKNSLTNGIIWYHIDRFFKTSPNGTLWVGIYPVPVAPTTYDFIDVIDFQNKTGGNLRKIGVYYTDAPLTTTLITSLNTQLTALFSQYRQASAVFVGDIKGVSDVNSLPDLNALTARRVYVHIGQDSSNEGSALYLAQAVLTRKTVGAIGTLLGLLSIAPLGEHIGYVAKYNIVIDAEFQSIGFGNGENWTAKTPSQLDALSDKNYGFFRKDPSGQITGAWVSDTYTATTRTDDYNDLQRNLVMDEICRAQYSVMFQELNGGLLLTNQGKLKPETIGRLHAILLQVLLDFETKNYIGEVKKEDVYINPNQIVATTSKVEFTTRAVPPTSLRKIEIKNSYQIS